MASDEDKAKRWQFSLCTLTVLLGVVPVFVAAIVGTFGGEVQKFVARYSVKGALVLVTFLLVCGALDRFRPIKSND